MLGRAGVLALCMVLGCEKAGPTPGPDSAPPRPADAAPPPPADAAPPPPADAAPPDAGPGPKPRRPPKQLDGCETDDDCSFYGDPCGGGLIPVNKQHEERARAAAQRRCPRENMRYLISGDTGTRCVKSRCVF